MTNRKVYAWQANGKYYLSLFPADTKDRAFNEYESEQALRLDVKKRRMDMVWENA